ncbi:hypothetical protein ACLESO_21680 [Pyxidicoccus sp. 3LG]
MKGFKLGLQVRHVVGAWMCTLTLAAGCGPSTEPEAAQAALGENRSEVVYGTDDRLDVYAHPDATPRFTPAPVRTGNTALSVGQSVAVIGSSSAIPFKIDSGGTVRDPRAGSLDFLVSTTDTFAGNSGSAVYETNNDTVASIVVRGDLDYVANGTCNVVNRCPETGCIGEQSTYVYPAIQALCATTNNASPRLCAGMPPPPVRPANSFVYHTGKTDNAQQHTVDRVIPLAAGDVVEVGTCGLEGAVATGSNALRLLDAQGTQVAGGGCYFKHRAATSGDYTLRAGCANDNSCGGTVVWKVTLNAHLVRGTISFNLSNTSSGSRNTANQDVTLSYGQVIDVGTCGLEGASGNGDTIVRLHRASGTVEAENDDAFGTCGSLSHVIYSVNVVGQDMPYQIRVGCFRNTSCSGTAAYVIYQAAGPGCSQSRRAAGCGFRT